MREEGQAMPTYIILGSYSEQGIRNIRQSPERLDAARQAIESAGGSIQFFPARSA